ncbi:hypothetical protein F8M41_014328 [Gigaspora margarita]|uniref:F-box domain-containing protein n=1 Tax=Gigaspora margarita TaxID=4874 RepID=A0A8H4ARJ7_GIGMA|nr:hypothetical protein F8M41_014328 [Gigaspora margarita]
MTTLPNECYYIIFNNFRRYHKSLFSCALVNRQWCRVIIPILWSESEHHFHDEKLIRTLLLMLNAEEQTLLIPFKISIPSNPNPLFEYSSYIISVTNGLHDGIRNWVPPYERYEFGYETENAIKCSLIAMFLRTGKNLKYLNIDNTICNQIIFENLYKNTTITSIELCNISSDSKPKAIGVLTNVLCENSTLTSLDLRRNQLGFEEMKTLVEGFYKNTTLNSLDLCNNRIGEEKH